MKKNAHFSVFAVSVLMVIFVAASHHAPVSTARDREIAKLVAPANVPDSSDIFEANRVYDLAISDAGTRTVYRCRVAQTRSNWVYCQASWRGQNGTVQNGNLWLNADNMAVVRLVQQ